MSVDDQLQQEAEKVIRLAGRKHLKNKLRNFENESFNTPVVSKRPAIVKWMTIAAAAVILILIPLWWMQSGLDADTQKVFTDNFETYRSPDSFRGNEGSSEKLWKEASAQYADGNYNSAAVKFEEFTKTNDTYLGWFYLGQCLLNIEGAEQNAVSALQKVLTANSTDHDYTQQTEWYLGLAHLKNNEVEKAREMFREIAKSDEHYKNGDARKILERLKL
ncbi:MAG: tetratricopeptide repeat protein [Bacteroidota bacterium]